MSNFTGADSKLQIGLEATYGVFDTVTTPTVQLEFLSESLHQNNTNVESEALVGAVTTPYFNIIGTKVEGDISYEVHPDKFGELLYAALGVEGTSTLNVDVYTHEFTAISGGSSLPSVVVVTDKKADVFAYTGMKIDTLTLETDPGSLLTSSISLVGQQELLGESTAALAVSTLNPYDFNDMKIYFGTAGTVAATNIDEATSMSFNYSNNLENDLYTADGNDYISEIDYQKRDITFDIETLYNAATNAYRENNYKTGDKMSVRIEFTHPVLAGATEFYKLTIDVLNAVITEAPNDIGGPDRMRIPLSFRALEVGTDEAITITLQDTKVPKYSA